MNMIEYKGITPFYTSLLQAILFILTSRLD